MVHIKKIKFRKGKDANKMLVRKLAVGFIMHGTLTTTQKKAKVLKTFMDRLTEKAKEKKESNRNFLLKYTNSLPAVTKMFTVIGPLFKDVQGGFVRISKLQYRASDGASMVRLTWTKPVVSEKKVIVKTEKS